MTIRLERLYAALAAADFDAYVASQRPNQLYWIKSAEPVSDLPNAAYLLLAADGDVIFPGQAFVYACRDNLPGYAIAPTEVGTASPTIQLVEHLMRRGYRRIVMDPLGRAAEDELPRGAAQHRD